MALTIFAPQQQRSDTASNWTAINPRLLIGELGYETDTDRFKIGTGALWNDIAEYFEKGAGSYTDEQAQDAIGGTFDSTLIYDDGAGTIKRAAIGGDVTIPAGSNTATIAAAAVSNAKLASMAAKTYKGRTTGSTGPPEDVPVATLKTDLGLFDTRIYLSGFANLDAVIAAHPTNDVVLVVTENYTFSADKTVPANLFVKFEGDGRFTTTNSTDDITILRLLDPGDKRVFFGPGKVIVPTGRLNLAWWAGVGDGTATTQNQWDAIVASLTASKGGVLDIPAYIYTKGDFDIVMPSGSKFKGRGVTTDMLGGSIIQPTTARAAFQIGGNQRFISFEAFGIDQQVGLGVGIKFTGTAPNSTFAHSMKDMVFYSGSEGVYVDSTDNVWETYFRVENCWFLYQSIAGFRMDNVNAGVSFIDSQFTPAYGSGFGGSCGIWLERCGQVNLIGSNNFQGLGASDPYAKHTNATFNGSTGLWTTVGAVNHDLPSGEPHIVLIKTTGTLPGELPTWEPETGYIVTVRTYYARRVSATTFTLHLELQEAVDGVNPVLAGGNGTGTHTLRTTLVTTADRPFAAIKVTGLFSQINILGSQGEGFPHAMHVSGVGTTEAVINILGALPQGLIKFAANTTVTVNDYGSKQGVRAFQDSQGCFVDFNLYGPRTFRVLSQYYDAGSTISPPRLCDIVGNSSIRYMNNPEEGVWFEHNTVNLRATAGYDALFGHLPLMKLWRGTAGVPLVRIGQGPDRDVKYNGYNLQISPAYDALSDTDQLAGYLEIVADNVTAAPQFAGVYAKSSLQTYGRTGNGKAVPLTSAATVTIDPRLGSHFRVDHGHNINFVLTDIAHCTPGQDIWIMVRALDTTDRTHTFDAAYFRAHASLQTGTDVKSHLLHFKHSPEFDLLIEEGRHDRWKKGTVTVDPASIAATTVASQTFTLAGAVVGDNLVLNPPAAGLTAGLLVLQSFVSAADTVTIVFQNTTGSAIDQASAAWNYTLLR